MAYKENDTTHETLWDVAVIGGGPAGMMAAGRAAERGAKVILLEKNDSLGKKLLITGGGRCNITNAEFNNRKFLENFKDDAKYLFSSFSVFNVKSTIDFFEKRNMPTKIEAYNRVFPVSDKAQSVWDVLISYMKENNVTVLSNANVSGLILSDKLDNITEDESRKNVADEISKNAVVQAASTHSKSSEISALKLSNGKIIRAKQFILATGGKSHPETGSTGDGFKWLEKIGHKVIAPEASLVPVSISDTWVKELQGVTLQKAKLTLFQNNIKNGSKIGRILFTHFGISGPTVLNMSKDIGELLKYGEVIISLDLLPESDYSKLNTDLQEMLKGHSNKHIKNSLGILILPAMVQPILKMAGIDPDTWSHSVTREERLALVKILKAVPMHVKGLLGVENAIITSGGVSSDEVDWKTMRSRLVSNLSFVGDILNINRPSGGYSLQLCWTTGFVAGSSVMI